MLPFNEVAKAALEAGKAVNEVGSLTTKIRSEYPDLFNKSGNLETQSSKNANLYEGSENIESPSLARSEYPSIFEKVEADKHSTIEIKQYSSEINEAISSVKEAEIYSNANLKEGVVNGRKALIRTDINMNQKDEFGLTNLERMKNGNPPLAPNGEIIELHHIGQKPNSPFAELTRTEHRGEGNDTILHDKTKESEIDRNVFQKERQAHWQNRIGVEV